MMKVQRPIQPKRDSVDVTPLDITHIPAFGLSELSLAIRDVIWWQQHQPITRQDRIARDQALIRLMQADWHVEDALQRLAA